MKKIISRYYNTANITCIEADSINDDRIPVLNIYCTGGFRHQEPIHIDGLDCEQYAIDQESARDVAAEFLDAIDFTDNEPVEPIA